MTAVLPRLLLLLLLAATCRPLAAAEPPRLVTMDWTVAETLLALGVVPQGVGEIAGYRAWVGAPAMPDSVRDIGLRSQPNLELLAQLSPDRILITRMFRSLEPVLSRIAATSFIDNQDGDTAWAAMVAQTRDIGSLAKRELAAEELIRATERHIAALRARIDDPGRPLLVVQFMDAVHVRVFGSDSLYGSVLDRLGLANAWRRPTNSWGFSLVSLQELLHDEGRLVVVEPLPIGVDLPDTGLWRALPSVRRGDVLRLPQAWSFGALPSVRRFADLLAAAL